MGLFRDWAKSRKMDDPVRGILRVTACTTIDGDATSSNYNLDGVVSADGVLPTAVNHSGIAKAKKWPFPGQELPVTVDRADPTRIRIEWDDVQTGDERGAASAARLAATMRGEGAPGTPPAGTADFGTLMGMAGTTVSSQVIDLRGTDARDEILGAVSQHMGDPEQMRAAIMQTLAQSGIDVPDATAGAQGAVSFGFPQTSGTGLEDPATRLRKLDALRDQQLVNADEYASLRAQILEDV
ncbi:MAG: hypothetical protein JWO02_4097 [Solirubrobacterales bacterium]|nr:hypothetical protein [Solirubrobacterales bacterium]